MTNRRHLLLASIGVLIFTVFTNLFGCSAPVHRSQLTTEAKIASDFSLWSKAVKNASANIGWQPGSVHTRIEVLDGDKKLESTKEIWSRLSQAPEGPPRSEIVKVVEDGKDVTETAKEEMQKQKEMKEKEKGEKVDVKLEFKHPFDPDIQDLVKAERTGESEIKQERKCAGFKWELKLPSGTVYSGTAWLDQDSGIPVEIQFVFFPLPDKVDAMNTRVIYMHSPDGHWHAKEMFIEAKGSFLFWTKHFHTHMVFDDHWRKD